MELGFCVSPALKNIACHPCHDYQITHQTLHTQFVVLENQWENILFFSNTVMARSDSMFNAIYLYESIHCAFVVAHTKCLDADGREAAAYQRTILITSYIYRRVNDVYIVLCY